MVPQGLLFVFYSQINGLNAWYTTIFFSIAVLFFCIHFKFFVLQAADEITLNTMVLFFIIILKY
jgi:hypothetical protein